MKETTRSEIWSILNEAFKLIHHAIQKSVPGVAMQARHHYNAAFWFRGYAEYSARERVIVLYFNIQMKGKQLHIWGDISREDGLILKDIVDTTSEYESEDDNALIEAAKQFASRCKKESQLIEDGLK
ncbi:MAG: hypothetical protein JWR26_2323 [Pedosphaera sp.]|nr:hypothetical protein [Pedosphaera sp.]